MRCTSNYCNRPKLRITVSDDQEIGYAIFIGFWEKNNEKYTDQFADLDGEKHFTIEL